MGCETKEFVKWVFIKLRFHFFFFFQGAKNHGVIMPDANKENTINQVWLA